MTDRMICWNCGETFPDKWNEREAQNTITFGQFLNNQRSIIFGGVPEQLKHHKKRVFQHRCPHCSSINVYNATEILEKFNVKTKKGNLVPPSRLYNTPKFKRYREIHKLIVRAEKSKRNL